MNEQEMIKAMDDANKAHHEMESQQQKFDAGILQAVKAIVSAEVFAEIESEIKDSDMTYGYKIVDNPDGIPQDNGFALGEVYVDQHCGICGDDYYGTISIPLPDGRYFQFSFNC